MNRELIKSISRHVLECLPNEACGFVIDGEYLPQENIHENPKEGFRIAKDKYPIGQVPDIIVHSHPEGPEYPSKKDQEGQQNSKTNWAIFCTKGEIVTSHVMWGPDVEIPDLIGRPFRVGPSGSDGKGDCYALIRDYYKLTYNIDLLDFPRTDDWWDKGIPMYENGFEKAGFYRISESDVRPGDVFLCQVKSKVANHGGVYLGDGMMMHHLINQLSRRDIVNRYRRLITHWLRYDFERLEKIA